MGVARCLPLLLVAACTSSSPTRTASEWVHPTKEILDLKADQAECERFFGSGERSQEQCLEAKGWKRTPRR